MAAHFCSGYWHAGNVKKVLIYRVEFVSWQEQEFISFRLV